MNDFSAEELNQMLLAAKHENFTTEFHERPAYDTDDLYYFDKNKKHVGSAFILKSGENKGKICVTKCPACKKENYAMNVLSGYCTWCPFDANENKESINE